MPGIIFQAYLQVRMKFGVVTEVSTFLIITQVSIASFPGLAQLSVASSMKSDGKLGG